MNIGNQAKIASATSLIDSTITQENAEEYKQKIEIEIFLLQHGLNIETNYSDKILIRRIIALLHRKNEEIQKMLVISA